MRSFRTRLRLGFFKFLLMVLKITVGDSFTLIHICENILTRHSQPKQSKTFKALLDERDDPKWLIERTISEQYQCLRSIFLEDSRLLNKRPKPPRKF